MRSKKCSQSRNRPLIVSTSGLLQSVTDPCGNTTSYTYTAMGQIKKVSMPSYDITYAYDDDRLTEINSKGTTYEIGYDALGRQTTVSAGDVTLSENEYTNNRLTASTTSGRRTEYTYDALDRITQIEYDQLGEKEIFYGANGLVSYTVDTDASTHTRYIYDSAERLTSEIEYNTEDLHDNSTITAGVYYSYRGGSNELSSVSRRANGSTDTINLTYGALASGTRPGYVYSEKYGTYAYLDYTYDTLGRLSTKTVVGNQTYTYAYRPFENNRTSMQVQSLSTPAGTYTYTYDDNGNIETETLNGNTTSYTYDTWGRMTEEANQAAGKRYVYGYAYGNLQYRKTYAYSDSDHINCLQTDTFSYTDPDMKDRLTSYNGTAISYGSTGTGMWIGGSSVFFADAGLVSLDNAHGVSYSYDSSLRRKQKTANGVTTQYYYAGDELMAQTKGGTTIRFKRSAAGDYVGLKYNNTNYYYVKNLQGDVIGIVDAGGTLKVSYLYDAWGRVLSVTGTLASTLGADNPIRYRSYYYDTETGWYFLGSRYYNPEWCRFISADTILGANQDIIGYNLFAYCSFNPVNKIDTNGFRAEMSAGIPKQNKQKRGIGTLLKANLMFSCKYVEAFTKSIKIRVGAGIGMGAKAKINLSGVDMELSACFSSTDSISISDLKLDVLNTAGLNVGVSLSNLDFLSYSKGYEHSFFDDKCTCNFFTDPIANRYKCPASTAIKPNSSMEMGFSVGAYFMVGGELSVALDIIKCEQYIRNIDYELSNFYSHWSLW